ncbi:MAG: calcineurin-like phosphoesterase C-terminal domain-containing protein [Muribaculaceae bacterium]|nr:calcineurin-like phosphoesterase C-terminal domain-containing protein [Muribaculaceae bacterium]
MKFLAISLSLLMLGAGTQLYAQSIYKSNLPVKPAKGVTVAGTVECDGKPVSGVVVSDGYEVTKTDKKGAYYLKSKKQNPQVFITAPAGYEPVREDAVPQFWADFTLPADKYERHDFRLNKVDNKKHATILITDVHLANQRNDVEIFKTDYVDKIRNVVKEYEAQGIPVYTLNLGDASWDINWYGHDFKIDKFRKTLNDANYPTAVYSVMGNHDNDPHTPCDENTDFNASLPYQKAMGPRYYSQNIGDVHYIFLDNIHYKNMPEKEEVYYDIKSKRNYIEDFTPEQLDWLRKDLANVPYDTPLVIAMHGPIFRWKALGASKKWTEITPDVMIRTEKKSTLELLDILKPYKEIHTVSGHTHKQCTVKLPADVINLTEHNISGTSGAWWRTRATGLKNLCPDGTPTAFEVFDFNGPELIWTHKTFEYPYERTFTAWDMNKVKEYFSTNEEVQTFRRLYPNWTDYADLPENYIYVNLWSWDPDGKLTITENGKELPIEMVVEENPIYTLSYPLRMSLWINNWNSSRYKNPSKFQLFRAKASTADAPVEISWTDNFGRETKETLNRPADFKLHQLND